MDGLQVSGRRPSLVTGTVLLQMRTGCFQVLPLQQHCNKPPGYACVGVCVNRLVVSDSL